MTQNTRASTADEPGSADAPRRSREWLIAVLLLAAVALCWISWRAGSPLLSTIRNIDVKDELQNLQGSQAAPLIRVP